MRKTYLEFMGAMFILANTAWGHLDTLRYNGTIVLRVPSATDPGFTQGGQVFTVGQIVTIGWNVTVPHNVSSYIYFSSTSTTSWGTALVTFPGSANLSVGFKTWQWTVPNRVTTSGRINVHQALMGFPLSDSTDDYNLASSLFTVQTTSPILGPPEQKRVSARQSAGMLFLDLTGFGLNAATAELLGLNGSVLRSIPIPGQQGLQEVALPTTSWPKGLAILCLNTEGKTKLNQLILIRP